LGTKEHLVNHTHGADLIISSPRIIGEGAVIERLRRKIDLEIGSGSRQTMLAICRPCTASMNFLVSLSL
jgi:hypothetical protein